MSDYKCIKSDTDGVVRVQVSLGIEMTVEDYLSMINKADSQENPLETILPNTNHIVTKIHEESECVWCGDVLDLPDVRGHFTHVETETPSTCPRCGSPTYPDGDEDACANCEVNNEGDEV